MGKTFKRNEGRRPKWDKRGNKSHKVREFEDDKFKHRPTFIPPLQTPEPPEPDISDFP
jgi:hypothetical protein